MKLYDIVEPRGWKWFDEDRLEKEKIKLLKAAGISEREITDFLRSMPNSRNVNDVIKKIKPRKGVEDFLRYKVQKSNRIDPLKFYMGVC